MRLGADGGDLTVEVTDDGTGLPDGPVAGVGLSSMRERAAEMGGSCRVEPATGGGTRVLARLPLPGECLTMEPLRVLVVEDHPLFRKGVVALLDGRAGPRGRRHRRHRARRRSPARRSCGRTSS